MNTAKKIKRISALDPYRTVIESWIHKYPCISAAQVCDWHKEDYAEDFKERTVSRFVKAIREQLGIPKSSPPREYTAVAELPPGKQMQVDFGEMYMPNAGGKGKLSDVSDIFSNRVVFLISIYRADELPDLFHYTPNTKYSQAAKMEKCNSGNVVRISEYAKEPKSSKCKNI